MRNLQVGMGVLVLMVLSGCPSEFGKDGRLNKAAHKDTMEQLEITRCSEAYKEQVCRGPNRDAKKCRECGG